MDFYGSVVLIVIQLIFLEGILSIDNAAVLGAMVSPLPDDEPIPWPAWLQGMGMRLNPILGFQRLAALRVGLLGAYMGRGAMLFITSFLIENAWVRLVGAAYLIRLAFNELGDTTPGVDTEAEKLAALKGTSFWSVVLTVELMDLVFSIDNVIAAVSLSSEIWVVMLGVGIGIIAMRFAAGIFSYAVQREPVLQPAAYILILNIGIQLILEQVWKVEISDVTRFAISVAIIFIALTYAHSPFLQKFRFILYGLSFCFGVANKLVDWILLPFKALFQWALNGFRLSKPATTK
jgi:YkoY family integral membrane protein